MTNTEVLEERIQQSGKKKCYLADCCGLTAQAFWMKCQGKTSFTGPEIKVLCKELNIDSKEEMDLIFFAD